MVSVDHSTSAPLGKVADTIPEMEYVTGKVVSRQLF
jgi:hypothetical protein